MNSSGISPERQAALIRLMDDDSPVVRTAVMDELKRLDRAGIDWLRKLARGPNRMVASEARNFLEELRNPDTIEEFTRFIRSVSYELETGCLLLNRTLYPDADVTDCCIRIDALAKRCRELMVLPNSPFEQCKAVNRVLFHEYGFRGNVEDFDDPLNSFLCQLLERRKGIPITLSILYILVAQRCGLELEPVGTPGRFLVGCFLEREAFYIDPFERGAFRTVREVEEMLLRNSLKPRPGFLAPTSVGEVLCRCCRNLTRQFAIRNDPEHSRVFAGFVHEFEEIMRRHAKP